MTGDTSGSEALIEVLRSLFKTLLGPAEVELEQCTRVIVGFSLEPLPTTRVEVEVLGELFGERATLWLGAEATEDQAKAVGQGVTIVHFAAHGMVDERRPLSSASL